MDELLSLVDSSQIATRVVEFVPRLLLAVLVLAGFLIAYRIIRPAFRGVLERAGLHEALVTLIVQNLFRYSMIILGVVMAADQLGVNVGAALAGLGIAGIAIGFAAQDTVANVISGILIFWDRPFLVDDWVETEGTYGQVIDITLRSTRIRTTRNTYVVLPNKTIIDTLLENYSKNGEIRIDVPIGIAYREDVSQARSVLLEAMASVDDLRETPPADVVVDSLGDSSVNLNVRVWVDDGSLKESVFSRVTEASKRALGEHGIEIPFPHLQLHVDGVKENVWGGFSKMTDRLPKRPASD